MTYISHEIQKMKWHLFHSLRYSILENKYDIDRIFFVDDYEIDKNTKQKFTDLIECDVMLETKWENEFYVWFKKDETIRRHYHGNDWWKSALKDAEIILDRYETEEN